MRHTFLVETVKNQLKSVYICGSYRKINIVLSLFWTTICSLGEEIWAQLLADIRLRHVFDACVFSHTVLINVVFYY